MKKVIILSVLLFLMLMLGISGCLKAENKNNDLESNTYITENITIGKGTEFELKGLLTIPSGATAETPCPAVVLVHGSGSSDMDETILDANKPFRDIAEYLASHGIAVIRYDKRSFTYGLQMVEKFGGSLTVYEESIEDAVLATEMLKSDPRINKDKVFIIGHSLGGMLAPRIHSEGGNFAGIISLAGTPRSLLRIIADQQILYYKETMEDGEELQAILTSADSAIEQQIDAIINMSDEEAKNIPADGGVTIYYYKEMEEHPISEYVKEITVPFLILQGSNDFQVYADKDYVLWQELLSGRQNAAFKLYEGLNHLFMPSTGATIVNYQEEYNIASHVDEQVLSDITEWIKAN